MKRSRLKFSTALTLALILIAAVFVLFPRHKSDATASVKSPAAEASPTTRSPSAASPSSPPTRKAGHRAVNPLITRQLLPLLTTYFTIKQGDTDETRLARVRPLVPKKVWPDIQGSFAGIPQGATMTSQVNLKGMDVERPAGQLYITLPVYARVRASRKTFVIRYETATVWVKEGTDWKLVHFGRDPNGTILWTEGA